MLVSQELQKEEPYFVLNFPLGNDKGFSHCDVCKCRMRTCFSKGRTSRYPYYYCHNRLCNAVKKSIQKADMERYLEELLRSITPTQEYAKYFKENVIEEWEIEHAEFEEARKLGEIKLQSLEEEKIRTMELIKKGVFPEEAGREELSRIVNGILVTRADVNENLIDRNQLEVLLNQAELFLTKIEPLYRGLSPTNKRRFITKIFPEGVYFYYAAEGKLRTAQKSLLFEFIDEINAQKTEKSEILTLPGIEPGLPG